MDKDKQPDWEKGRKLLKDLREPLDRFEKLAETPEQKFTIMRFRNAYLEAKDKYNTLQGVQRELFQQGLQKGIHAEKQRDNLENTFYLRDQELKKNAMKEAKDYYRNNYSLTLKFTEKTKGKDKDMSLDK